MNLLKNFLIEHNAFEAFELNLIKYKGLTFEQFMKNEPGSRKWFNAWPWSHTEQGEEYWKQLDYEFYKN